jgi:hypothetical protein
MSMLSLQNGCQTGRRLSDINHEKKTIYCPLKSNWLSNFFGEDLQEKKMFYVDLLNSAAEIHNSAHMQTLATFLPSLLQRKFSVSGFEITIKPHTVQFDSSSCGVLSPYSSPMCQPHKKTRAW